MRDHILVRMQKRLQSGLAIEEVKVPLPCYFKEKVLGATRWFCLDPDLKLTMIMQPGDLSGGGLEGWTLTRDQYASELEIPSFRFKSFQKLNCDKAQFEEARNKALAWIMEQFYPPVPLVHPVRRAGVHAAGEFYPGSPVHRAGFNHGVSWTLSQVGEKHAHHGEKDSSDPRSAV